METPEGKVSLLDAVPVRCDHILTEWEGDYAVISYPRFKYEWMRRHLKGWIYKITLCQLLIKPLFQDRIIPLLWNSY